MGKGSEGKEHFGGENTHETADQRWRVYLDLLSWLWEQKVCSSLQEKQLAIYSLLLIAMITLFKGGQVTCRILLQRWQTAPNLLCDQPAPIWRRKEQSARQCNFSIQCFIWKGTPSGRPTCDAKDLSKLTGQFHSNNDYLKSGVEYDSRVSRSN